MARFFDIFKNFIWIGLVILAFFSLTMYVQNNADVGDKVMDQSGLNDSYVDLRSSISSMESSSKTQEGLFSTENPTSGFGSILMFSIVSAGRVFKGMVMGIFNIFVKLPLTYLGIDPIFTSIFATLLIVAVMLGLWAVYKLGG